MPTTNEAPTHATPPKPQTKRRCRSLTVAGLQCNSTALHGRDFCFHHEHHRHPQCPSKFTRIVIPLLEDHASIQLVASQVAQGLFADSISPQRAGKILYACQIAAFTLPRPPRASRPINEGKPVITEPVTEITTGPDGDLLGPEEKYVGPGGVFEPYWSFTKYLYEQQCEALGKPKPTCFEDMPACGWMGEEEYKQDPDEWVAPYRAKIAALKEEKKRHEEERVAAGHPASELYPECVQKNTFCRGPEGLPRCGECDQIAFKKEQEAEANNPKPNPDHNPGQILDEPIGDLKAMAPARVRKPNPRRRSERSTLNAPRCPGIKLANTANPHIPNPHPPATTQGGAAPGLSRSVARPAAAFSSGGGPRAIDPGSGESSLQ